MCFCHCLFMFFHVVLMCFRVSLRFFSCPCMFFSCFVSLFLVIFFMIISSSFNFLLMFFHVLSCSFHLRSIVSFLESLLLLFLFFVFPSCSFHFLPSSCFRPKTISLRLIWKSFEMDLSRVWQQIEAGSSHPPYLIQLQTWSTPKISEITFHNETAKTKWNDQSISSFSRGAEEPWFSICSKDPRIIEYQDVFQFNSTLRLQFCFVQRFSNVTKLQP